MKTLDISFGAMVPSLKEQIGGLLDDEYMLAHFQLDADALVRVHMRGLIPDSQIDAARNRLFKKIQKAVGDSNGL